MQAYKATITVSYKVRLEIQDEAEALGDFLGRVESNAWAGQYNGRAFDALCQTGNGIAEVEILNFAETASDVPEPQQEPFAAEPGG